MKTGTYGSQVSMQASGWATPKFYLMRMWPATIRAFGSANVTSMGFGECSHAILKDSLRFTNRHSAEAVDKQVHRLLLCCNFALLWCSGLPQQTCFIPHLHLTQSGRPCDRSLVVYLSWGLQAVPQTAGVVPDLNVMGKRLLRLMRSSWVRTRSASILVFCLGVTDAVYSPLLVPGAHSGHNHLTVTMLLFLCSLSVVHLLPHATRYRQTVHGSMASTMPAQADALHL